MRLNDRRSAHTRRLMHGKTGSGEPNERIREPARTIRQDGPAVIGFIPKALTGVVVALAPGGLLALEDVSPLGLTVGVLANAPWSVGLRRKVEQRSVANRADLPRNVDDG